jgi:hypothetical protein
MFRQYLYLTAAVAFVAAAFMACNDNPTTPPAAQGETPTTPAGATLIYSDGFGGDLSKWAIDYMILAGAPHYPHMRISSDAARTGKYSVTTDSNQTALIYELDADTRVESGIAGVQFYIMAKENGGINFAVEIGKNAGSSGGLGKAFGIGFDPNDSIKCKYFDMLGNNIVEDSMIAPIQLDHWYKCVVEVDLSGKKVTYFIDDAKVLEKNLPTTDMAHIDRLLVFRGATADRPNYATVDCKEGSKQYFTDDIVLYKK